MNLRSRPVAVVTAGAIAAALGACSSGQRAGRPPPRPAGVPTAAGRSAATAATPAAERARRPVTASPQRRMRLERTIADSRLALKSIVASGHGLVFAQNMMYRHTITVYDRGYRLVRTIPDALDLAAFGVPGHRGVSRGAPVEAAFSPDGRYAYVSNYSMYGAGFGPEGTDTCSPSSGYDPSYVYRVDVARLAVDRVIPVGAVPKYVAATPDGRYVLVTNWCSYSLTVIDARTLRPVRSVPLGAYPRGIAVDRGSRLAYVAVMGGTAVAVVDLHSFTVDAIEGVGGGPRHLVLDPTGRWLYVTLNRDGTVAKVDLNTRRVVARVSTGSAPRSMAIADDGRSLHVVNYESDTVSKVRAADMRILQTLPTNAQPIGVTYDVHDGSGFAWVACYTGSIMVFRDG